MHRAAAWYPFGECVLAHLARNARQRRTALSSLQSPAVSPGDARVEPHVRALATALTYVSQARGHDRQEWFQSRRSDVLVPLSLIMVARVPLDSRFMIK
jgi:hypothetical protein